MKKQDWQSMIKSIEGSHLSLFPGHIEDNDLLTSVRLILIKYIISRNQSKGTDRPSAQVICNSETLLFPTFVWEPLTQAGCLVRRGWSVRQKDFINMKNLSSNGCIKTPLYRLIELRLTFGYLIVQVFTPTYMVSIHFLRDLYTFYFRN